PTTGTDGVRHAEPAREQSCHEPGNRPVCEDQIESAPANAALDFRGGVMDGTNPILEIQHAADGASRARDERREMIEAVVTHSRLPHRADDGVSGADEGGRCHAVTWQLGEMVYALSFRSSE